MRERAEARRPSVHGQTRPGGDPARIGTRVDAAGLLRLEGRDLGHVEDVTDVDPVARDLDPAEAVDREVAERVRGRARRGRERDQRDEDGALHA